MSEPKVLLGCIGGLGALDLLNSGALDGKNTGSVDTPFGLSGPIYRCVVESGDSYLLLPRHADPPMPIASSLVNHRANVYALKESGATAIVSWSGTRAISHNYRIGQFALIEDLIDETRGQDQTFWEHGVLADLRQWPIFCPHMHKLLEQSLEQLALDYIAGGTYLCCQGPRRETPAEVRKYGQWGSDLLGHSLVPEVFLARQLQICAANICLVTDYAETGSRHRPFGAGSLFSGIGQLSDHQRVDRAIDCIPRILELLCQTLSQGSWQCTCRNALAELIASGRLPADFRAWFTSPQPDLQPAK